MNNSNRVSLSLCEGNELPKTGFVFHSNIGEDFSIQFNTSGFEPMYESAVGEPVQSGGGVNSCDPKSPKIAFACASVCVGVVPSLLYRFFSGALEVISSAPVTCRMLKDPATTFAAHTSCFYSCHLKLLLRPTALSAIASTISPGYV